MHWLLPSLLLLLFLLLSLRLSLLRLVLLHCLCLELFDILRDCKAPFCSLSSHLLLHHSNLLRRRLLPGYWGARRWWHFG